MSDRGSGSGGHRRSDRLAKGKAVAYAPESSPDTDDEYDAMEDVRTRVDASLAREPAGWSLMPRLLVQLLVRLGLLPRPGVVIGRSAGPSETTRPSPQPRSTGILPSRLKRQRSEGIPDSAGTIPEDYVAPGFRYPPHGGIRPRYPVAVEISDTPLLTNLLAHPSSLVRRCQEPPYSAGRGGWSEFSRLLAVSRPEYREFLIELGFGPFLSIPYVSVYHPAIGVPSLGIRFGGRAPPSEPIDGFEAREILGLADRDAIEGPGVLLGQHISSSAAFLGMTGPPFPRPLSACFEISTPEGALGFSRIRRLTSRTLLEFRTTVDCIRDAEIIFQPYSSSLVQRLRYLGLSSYLSEDMDPTPRSWELLLAERNYGRVSAIRSGPRGCAIPGVVRAGFFGVPDVSSRGRGWPCHGWDGHGQSSYSVFWADREASDMQGGGTARGGDGADAEGFGFRDAEVAVLLPPYGD
uniref:Uncharacterized protein n=1 Tax=Fagus sylvatica TaxID=28930 RepID=A0A2N9EGT4_FAGSY